MACTKENAELRATMPLFNGAIVNLDYVPEHRLHEYRKRWGDWCRKHPKHEWPDWLVAYVEKQKHVAPTQRAA